ncbi:MAG: hypothetical protein NTY53_18290 [Kiritimatiellaeota bacterium]|nr:hypothetical protein [Kiritimatiellota bacterium]
MRNPDLVLRNGDPVLRSGASARICTRLAQHCGEWAQRWPNPAQRCGESAQHGAEVEQHGAESALRNTKVPLRNMKARLRNTEAVQRCMEAVQRKKTRGKLRNFSIISQYGGKPARPTAREKNHTPAAANPADALNRAPTKHHRPGFHPACGFIERFAVKLRAAVRGRPTASTACYPASGSGT